MPRYNLEQEKHTPLLKQCMIEVYLLEYNFESHLNDAIKENNLQLIKHYGTLRRYNWSIPYCGNFMRNLCHAALM